ncbi:MAG: leucine-rich repeat domain-containing protein [Mariniblastus sp.]
MPKLSTSSVLNSVLHCASAMALLILTGLLSAPFVSAQDFSVGSSSIQLKKYSPDMMEEIKKRKFPKRVLLDKVSGDAELAEVAKWNWVESLEIRSDSVSELGQVAKLINLKKLRLGLKASKENPTDLTPLAGLENLEELDLYANPVTKVEALEGLTHLKVVKLYMARVSSIDFVAKAPDLEELNLYGYRHTFENYEPITKLKNLKKLNVYMNTQAVDEKLAALKSLTSLEEIRLSNCKKITTFDFIENCKSMKRIDASWCRGIVDYSALSALPMLEQVTLTEGTFKNLDFLKGKEKLKQVTLSRTPIANVNELSGLPSLESLYLDGTEVTDITGLGNSPALSFLSISKTKVSDISPLQSADKLYGLRAVETLISDLSPLAGKQGLTNLYLGKTPVTDLSPLKDLPKLRYLDLTGTAVSDISVVGTLGSLATLSLGSTKVTDFSVLHDGLPRLRSVTLPASISEDQLAALKEKRPKVRFTVEKVKTKK